MNDQPTNGHALAEIPDPTNSEEYADLVLQIADLTANIEGMEDQLEVRDDYPWRSQCTFNLRKCRALRDELLRRKQAMDSVAHKLNKRAVGIAYNEDKTRLAKERAELRKRERIKKHEARQAHEKLVAQQKRDKERRIAEANSDQERFQKAFKAVVKERLGEAAYLELIEETKRRMELTPPSQSQS